MMWFFLSKKMIHFSDFLAPPRCFCFLISGVSDSTPLSRSLGICFGSAVFLPQTSPGETGGKPTLKVALNIQNSQDFNNYTCFIQGSWIYDIYIYVYILYISFSSVVIARNVWTFKGRDGCWGRMLVIRIPTFNILRDEAIIAKMTNLLS